VPTTSDETERHSRRTPRRRSSAPDGLDGPRRLPRQRRSREIVDALLEATRLLLGERDSESLTTNLVAARAGVSIGSLYRYFPNLDALLSAVHRGESHDEAERLSTSTWTIDALPLRDVIPTLIDYQLDRHRRLLDCYGRFHQRAHRATSLAHALGATEVERHIRRLLELHADQVRARDLDHAAFFLTRGLSAIVRTAVEERPEKLGQPGFRNELIELASRYLLIEGGDDFGSAGQDR
jgi:AcrR family transcriptional regulator